MSLKMSVITPTHRVSHYLNELYESLKLQTHTDWEWIVYLNGGATLNDFESLEISDERVKVFVDNRGHDSIGELKNRAFNLGSGDVLIEADHDDMLTQDCLEKLNLAFYDKSVDFVYSDCIYLQTNSNFIPHNPRYGWTWKNFHWKGKDYISMNSFPPSSHSLSYIWWAPNHVRSWRASSYRKMGGHNPLYSVCDDHELLIRTYLECSMLHLNDVLYVYRVDGENTVYKKNAEIQEVTRQLNLEFAEKLAVREAKLKELDAIYLTTSDSLHCQADFSLYAMNRLSSEFTIRLPSDSAFVVKLNENILFYNNPIALMSELYRVLSHGGWIFMDFSCDWSYLDYRQFDYKTFWNMESLRMFCESELSKLLISFKGRFITNSLEVYSAPDGSQRCRAQLNVYKPNKERFPGDLR